MAKSNFEKNKALCSKKYPTPVARVNDAQAAGEMAAKLFGAVAKAGNTITITVNPGQMGNIIDAIDTEDFNKFLTACETAGITDYDMVVRMWDATYGSLNAQSVKPCW